MYNNRFFGNLVAICTKIMDPTPCPLEENGTGRAENCLKISNLKKDEIVKLWMKT